MFLKLYTIEEVYLILAECSDHTFRKYSWKVIRGHANGGTVGFSPTILDFILFFITDIAYYRNRKLIGKTGAQKYSKEHVYQSTVRTVLSLSLHPLENVLTPVSLKILIASKFAETVSDGVFGVPVKNRRIHRWDRSRWCAASDMPAFDEFFSFRGPHRNRPPCAP